jgi:DNA processing protein
MLGEELARAGVVVVSGMARGIDAAAHQAALAAGGTTWAVWGAGPDRVYPPEHRGLAEDIAASGALITEHPPGTPPRRHHFPERNRLIAGACRVTVVVEAAARSGALSTARAAADEGRDVLAVPGPVFSATSVGPNTLLRIGARPLLTPADALELVGAAVPGPAREPDGSDGSARLLEHLPCGSALTADELAAAAGIGVAVAVAGLLELEVAGTVVRSPDGRYARRRGMAAAGPRVGEYGGMA